MIRGSHVILYSADAEADRAFLRDVLEFPHVDVGGGWLIFDVPEADMGCHPADPNSVHGEPSGTNHISFYCDDVRATREELKGRGVEFVDGISDRGYGLVTHFKVPGGFEVELYQPKYAKGK